MLGDLSAVQIETLLHSEWVARLGCHAEGETYVVPISYAYDGSAIYGHSADGLKLRMLRANPKVCIEVDHVDNLANWQSVIAWGRFEELRGAAATHALGLLVKRLEPMITSDANTPTHGNIAAHKAEVASQHAAIYRVVLGRKTGRFERR